jgi:putative hydrolase of the HAD superfamily
MRAIVFDLDDTLYPYEHFVASGFRAVAAHLERERGLPSVETARRLRRAFRNGDRGRELQRLCEQLGLDDRMVPALVSVIHEHVPTIQLAPRTLRMLQGLRRSWRVGILTNGAPAVQERKLKALGLEPAVDAAVCACAFGDGSGKPAAEGFHEILGRLGTSAASSVFVGDDPVADMAGAGRLGMKTILLRTERLAAPAPHVDAYVGSLWDVPAAANALLKVEEFAHAS